MKDGGASNWKEAARGLGLPVCGGRVDRIAPVLDDLLARSRSILDEDLSLVDPVGGFRPAVKAAADRSKAAAGRSAAPATGNSD